MKVAITGASGFVGSLAKKRMSTAGYSVVDLKRPWEPTNNIDVLIHCAAYIPPSYSDRSEIEKCITDNTIATSNLLDKAERQGVKAFIHLSSGQIYKRKCNHDDPGQAHDIFASEQDAVYPERAHPYLVSKAAADFLVGSHEGKIRTVILRPSSIYGIGMKPVGVIHRLIKKIKNHETIDMRNEDYHIDLVHVEDVVDMIKKCAESKVSGVYNVGGGNHTTTRQLAIELGAMLGVEPLLQNTKSTWGHPPLDIRKARGELGYHPINWTDGLKSFVRVM